MHPLRGIRNVQTRDPCWLTFSMGIFLISDRIASMLTILSLMKCPFSQPSLKLKIPKNQVSEVKGMKRRVFFVLVAALISHPFVGDGIQTIRTLNIGAAAPDFDLP